MTSEVTLALVARSVDYGETNRICTLLTARLGKISALARGARKSRRRYGGALALFVLGRATVQPPTRGEMYRLERFECLEDLGGPLSSDVVKLAHGSYILELSRELWPPGQPEPRAFGLTAEALQILAARPASASLLRAFELRILDLMGLAPSLERCVRCGDRAIAAPLGLDAPHGGVLCRACAAGAAALSNAARDMLVALSRGAMAEAAAAAPATDVAREAREVMLALVCHHLGRAPRSLDFLLQLSGRGRR